MGQAVRARAFVLAAALFAPTVVWAEDAATSFRELLIQYRCPGVDRLEQIYEAGDPSDTQVYRIRIAAGPGFPGIYTARVARPECSIRYVPCCT
jgi:hypothetical protein